MIVSPSKAYFRMSRPTREDLGGGEEGGGKGERGGKRGRRGKGR